MKASAEDERAMKEALRLVVYAAECAAKAPDTDAIRLALHHVRMTAMNAYALANAIEDNTRARAAEDLASTLAARALEPAL